MIENILKVAQLIDSAFIIARGGGEGLVPVSSRLEAKLEQAGWL